MATNKRKKRNVASGVVSDMLHGRWISTRFFSRHWAPLLAIVIMLLVYITNRYQCMTAMETIKTLERELTVVKTERIRQKSRYMSSIRESAMQGRIDSLNLRLKISQQPPFKLTLDD